ncbi:MAG: helix-turn-helix domain-containing protein [Clostridiales bacterium]|jgi:transcriptional regulator with XRE-family HTH domain|nr:helix-turn-helix domain-containing protein [Clostridiales bacterium]
MKEINIANTIIQMRKEKGITQDNLAEYIGVSKASVSKWETGQSYPDITFLPLLAAYFNISIDDLIGYSPQMPTEGIRKLYHQLSGDFANKPFDSVMGNCREIVKKYYSCYPLLIQIGALYINYGMALKDAEKTASVITEAKELFIRVKNESNDVELSKQALSLEATCALALGDPDEVLALLEGQMRPHGSPEGLLASAYQMSGKIKEAKAVLQVGVYQHMLSLLSLLPPYLILCTDEPGKYNEIYKRSLAIAEAFDIEKLHPAMLIPLYIYAAQGYVATGDKETALDILQKYTELVTGAIYPLRLKGDSFFDLIDSWLEEFPLGTELPRDEKTVKQSMAEALSDNPAFSKLMGERRFQNIVKRLKGNVLVG